ncbi:hypothetical protein DTO271G3_1734 [Paecilomyces variotii]|nr:hypothetical protein DTO271G3_1734 [Paecilomyces variotii]
MTGTLKKAVASILHSSSHESNPKGTADQNRTQENDHTRTGKIHNINGPDAKTANSPYGTERSRLQRGATKLPTITGCSPQFYAPKAAPLPPVMDRRGILSRNSKMWNTVFKRVVKFRDSKYVKKFKHTWGKKSSLVAKPHERVFRFREVSKGSGVYPSLAYDEVSEVLKYKNKAVRHVKSPPANPVTQEPILPSKPLPSLPPDADPVEDIRAAIRTPFASRLTPPRRAFPRKSKIKEEWLASSPPEPESPVHEGRKHFFTGGNNHFLTPAPASTRTHSTVSSLVHFYEQESSTLEYPGTFDNRLQKSTSTGTLENLSSTSTDAAPNATRPHSDNPFSEYPIIEDSAAATRKHIKSLSNVPEFLFQRSLDSLRGSRSSGTVRLSCNTFLSGNQTETRFSIHSDIDATKRKIHLSLSPSVQFSHHSANLSPHLRRASSSADHLRSRYVSTNKAMSDSYPVRTKRQLGQLSPHSPLPDVETIGRSFFPGNENTNRRPMSPTGEEFHLVPAPISSVPAQTFIPANERTAPSRIPIASGIPIATGSDLLNSPIRYERRIIERMNASVGSRSPIHVPLGAATTRNSALLEDIGPVNAGPSLNSNTDDILDSASAKYGDAASPKSNIDDPLDSPIPQYEDSALTPSLQPQNANSAATPLVDTDDDIYTSNGQLLLCPQGVCTGEYRAKLPSRLRLDLGPTMHISRSAEKLIMGTQDDVSPDNRPPRPTQRSLGEGIRASIGSRFSIINLKNAMNAIHGTESDATENGSSLDQDGNAHKGSKAKARADNETSSPTDTPRSKRSSAQTLKRDFSGKEMNLFRRLGSRTSLSSLSSSGSKMCIPEDAPPVPAVPAEYTAAKGGNTQRGISRPGSDEPSAAAGRGLAAMPSFNTLVATGIRDFRDRALHSHPVETAEARTSRDSRFPLRTSSLQYLGGNGATAIRGPTRMRAADSVPEFSERGAVQARPATSRRFGVLRSVFGFLGKSKAKEGKTSQANGWRGLKRPSKNPARGKQISAPRDFIKLTPN